MAPFAGGNFGGDKQHPLLVAVLVVTSDLLLG